MNPQERRNWKAIKEHNSIARAIQRLDNARERYTPVTTFAETKE